MRLEFMAKLYFARQTASVAALIDGQRDVCREWLVSFRAQADALSSDRRFEWLVYQFRLGQIEAMLHWLDICEQTLVTA